MDAAPVDADVKLYKASAELLSELQAKLPLLLYRPDGRLREWIFYNKTIELTRILDSFQEWPQLLDPILADLVHTLTRAFLCYCQDHAGSYRSDSTTEALALEPLPRSICRLLYVFSKVRGHKIIVRLLNNEPRYIEPLLVCFQSWGQSTEETILSSWQERYIMLLWLSHLMLAPFELATISGIATDDIVPLPNSFRTLQLPDVAQSLLAAGFRHLCVASKDREAASTLIVRISLREDMQCLHLPQAVIHWCRQELRADQTVAGSDQYRAVGLLTLLHGMINSASSVEAAPFVEHVFETCRYIATEEDELALTTRQFAPSRKLLIKTMRSAMLHTIAISAADQYAVNDNASDILEEGIQILLEWLADTDTPVRQAASKALGIVILKLDSSMSTEVVEAILGCLDENILLENLQTGELLAATDLINADLQQYKRNVNAVDQLKWHGAMLTLGHVLFRRSPPVEQLGPILEALLIGLAFEQRSNVGTSMGVAVRDAACFGIWSLGRKYSTKEVEATELSASFGTAYMQHRQSTLQKVANHLVVASCLDPSGNLRRGASAALQELIGRHPDTIEEGISVVQRVDYHAVARRSTAISTVAEEVAQLAQVYQVNILYSLLGWRGCRAVDADSRRQAAVTIGSLFSRAENELQISFAKELVSQISNLKPSNVGTNAAARHGLLLALTAVLEAGEAVGERAFDSLKTLLPVILDLKSTTGLLSGRVTPDLVHVLEATAKSVSAGASALLKIENSQKGSAFLPTAVQVLDRCTTATEDDLVASVAAQANVSMFALLDSQERIALLQSWLPNELPRQKGTSTCKGRIESMSQLYSSVVMDSSMGHIADDIVRFLANIITSELGIETKLNAMIGITNVIRSENCTNPSTYSILTNAVLAGLSDYTSDQRGDVGSLLRSCSIEAVHHLQLAGLKGEEATAFVQAVVRLAAEKLTKVRFAAWTCLKTFWESYIPEQELHDHYSHQADISSFAYYKQMMKLITLPWLQNHLLQGLLSAIAGGTDDISQVTGDALVSFLEDRRDMDLRNLATFIVEALLERLRLVVQQEDREVVPILDMLCLLLEQFPQDTEPIMISQMPQILGLLNDLQTPNADIPRIQALVRLLSDLALLDAYRLDSADKISRKLLHKWPKVRQAAADAIFLLDPVSAPTDVDWNAPAIANKAKVVAVRRKLGVAGRATTVA